MDANKPTHYETAQQVINAIPSNWRDCEIYVADSIGNPRLIQRVTLHKNANGRRVIMLHEKATPLP